MFKYALFTPLLLSWFACALSGLVEIHNGLPANLSKELYLVITDDSGTCEPMAVQNNNDEPFSVNTNGATTIRFYHTPPAILDLAKKNPFGHVKEVTIEANQTLSAHFQYHEDTGIGWQHEIS